MTLNRHSESSDTQSCQIAVNRCFLLNYKYFKNNYKKVCVYKNKPYLYIIIINTKKLWQLLTHKQ